ncbi:hypothetical protein [Megalodesulfovibrio paquesii]
MCDFSRFPMAAMVITLTLLLGCLLPARQAPGGQGVMTGGACQYDEFPGQATIEAVAPQAEPRPDLPYAALSVTFSFVPDSPVRSELYEPGKLHHLSLAGGRPPGERFVTAHDLHRGRTLPCRLRIIRQGTCTPVLFEFPGIDLTSDVDFP